MKPFEELITNTKKKSYDDYLRNEMIEEREQIIKGIKFEREIELNFRNQYEKGELEWKIGIVPDKMIDWANNELDSGNVAAVDGTNMYPIDLISGVFCQVGVGGLSYKNDEPTINVQSITSHITNDTDAGKYFGQMLFGEDKKLTKFDIGAAMQYWELEYCLERKEKWTFHDGNFLPYELLVHDSGRVLLTKLFSRVNPPIGIIKSTRSPKYKLLGRFLKPMEYMIIETGEEFFLQSFSTMSRHGGYRVEEQNFLKNYASRVVRGVFKAHSKSYVFEIHKDIFDKAIALIIADSLRNPRGLPFLIDLIDSKLSALFENNIYRDRMHSFLLEQGELMENINEREMRSW